MNQRVSSTADDIEAALRSRLPSFGMRTRSAPPEKPHWSDKVEFQIDVRTDIMKILGSVRPERLLVKSDPVWEGFPISGNARAANVLSIEDAGVGTVASLSTSTGTYIGAGFAMHNTALVAADRAVAKAELSSDKRFESVNEFRAQLNDQAATFLSRNEYNAQHESLEDKVQALTDRINSSQGKTEGSQLSKANLYAALAAVATGLGIVVLLANNMFK